MHLFRKVCRRCVELFSVVFPSCKEEPTLYLKVSLYSSQSGMMVPYTRRSEHLDGRRFLGYSCQCWKRSTTEANSSDCSMTTRSASSGFCMNFLCGILPVPARLDDHASNLLISSVPNFPEKLV